MRTLIGKFLLWAIPQDVWCPCLECVLARALESRCTKTAEKRRFEEHRDATTRHELPTKPFGKMYQRPLEH